QFINANLHRGARAQRRIEEDQRDRTTCEWLCSISAPLKTRRRVEQRIKLCTRPVGGSQEISRHDLTNYLTLASAHPRTDRSLQFSSRAVAADAAHACRSTCR